MPLYSFRCPACGIFDTNYSIQACPTIDRCPVCEQISPKVITSVRLGYGRSFETQLTDFCQSTAENPQIVQGNLPAKNSYYSQYSSIHDHSAHRNILMSTNPRHYNLPKP